MKDYPGLLMKFVRMPSGRLMMLEAVFWLGLARLAILFLPFRWIAPHLGAHMAETADVPDRQERDAAVCISQAVQRAACHLPWECKCLVQAISGKLMLRVRGISSTLYLGLARDETRQLTAHAWLRCGDIVLTGGPGNDRFTVISAFGDDIS